MPKSITLINRIQDLPELFCLDSYAGTEHLDALGWVSALAIRHFSFRVIESTRDLRETFSELNDPKYAEFVSDYESIFKSYQETSEKLLKWPHPGVPLSSEFWITAEVKAGPVQLLTRNDLHQIVNSPEKIDERKIHLSINVQCSDEQLIDNFRETLASIRSTRSLKFAPKNFNDKDFLRWHRLAILPYLDLTLWASFNDSRIAQHVLGDAIFPNRGGDTTQAIRQTVKPLATKLMQWENILTLSAQGTKKKG